MIDKNNLYLNHILESCEHIIEFTKDIDFEAFIKMRLLQILGIGSPKGISIYLVPPTMVFKI